MRNSLVASLLITMAFFCICVHSWTQDVCVNLCDKQCLYDDGTVDAFCAADCMRGCPDQIGNTPMDGSILCQLDCSFHQCNSTNTSNPPSHKHMVHAINSFVVQSRERSK